MKRLVFAIIAVAMMLAATGCAPKYESVEGDPMKTRIYTLDNGLKVYMSVNKDKPRIQTYIAVRSGGKNDPADNTGLAHYLEHIMFKGTESFGTSDYAAEKPLLDKIEELFNLYRTKTDPAEREAIYHQIDSVSYAASLISIPNEYDKLMSVIGASGTNAFTSNDVTCYTEDIPSNQIENWAKVQSDRFKNLVVRGFHTELEAVYEEYNMYLNDDQENAMIAIDSVLFKNHPYGKQSVIGTQEHLKNPSISAIKKQKATYYVPNNTAICLSGDFDPEQMLSVINKYFGDWKPNPDIPEFKYEAEDPILAPVEKDVFGTEAEFVMMSWRYPGGKDLLESEMSAIVSEILYNGQAGLVDVDVNQKQRVLAAAISPYDRVDYGEMLCFGYPKEGQSLEEVRDILLEEIAKLRNGDFDDDILEAASANFKLAQMRALESNSSRVSMFMEAFIAGVDWETYCGQLDRLAKVTKQDVVDWARKYLAPESYALVFKRLGVNPKSNKIEAPKITAIATNRDMQSAFLTEVQNTVVAPIEPVFPDFNKDVLEFETRKGENVVYSKNGINDIAQLAIRFNIGTISDPELAMALSYLDYLGTPQRSSSEIGAQEYKLACSHSFTVGSEVATLSISGLSENIPAELAIVYDLISNAVGDKDILESLKFDEITSRAVNKQTQSACNSALRTYIQRGPEFIKTVTMPNSRIMALDSDALLEKVRSFMGYAREVLYYGPMEEQEVRDMLLSAPGVAAELKPLERIRVPFRQVSAPEVFLAPYDSRQFNYIQYSDRGETFSLADAADIRLFNEYFGGGMNTVVFQEMREARALAYSAGANLASPTYPEDTYCFYATIGSQNDKLQQAVEAFDQIINDMPLSEKGFEIAVSGLESNLRTQRTSGMSLVTGYVNAREMNLDVPMNQTIYEAVPGLSLESLKATQEKWVKDRTYIYGILGDSSDLDLDFLRTLGPVRQLSLEDIFGY